MKGSLREPGIPDVPSVAHTHLRWQVNTNFCLYMPLYDHMYGTAHSASEPLHAAAWSGAHVTKQRRADVVLLGHGGHVLSVLSLPWVTR